jgi:hypothetical protein
MDHSLTVLLERLRDANLTLRHRLEIAQAVVPEINSNLSRLLALQALPDITLLGAVIHQQPYATGLGPTASGQVFLANIRIPGGLGVLLLDSEEYLELKGEAEGFERAAATKFLAFDECPPAIQAMLLPQVAGLLEQLCRLLNGPV